MIPVKTKWKYRRGRSKAKLLKTLWSEMHSPDLFHCRQAHLLGIDWLKEFLQRLPEVIKQQHVAQSLDWKGYPSCTQYCTDLDVSVLARIQRFWTDGSFLDALQMIGCIPPDPSSAAITILDDEEQDSVSGASPLNSNAVGSRELQQQVQTLRVRLDSRLPFLDIH